MECMPIDDIPCFIKHLPLEDQVAAASDAIAENPNNRVDVTVVAPASDGMRGLLDAPENAEPPLTLQRMALLVSRRYAPGVNLTVGFLERTSEALISRIIKAANRWSEFANVHFIFAANARTADMRITFLQAGYWNYLGTDMRRVPAGQATTCFQGFNDGTTDAEITRVVTHEMGHSLGLIHEHVTKEIRERIDPELAIADFMQSQSWSREDVIAQVLNGPAESELSRSPSDVLSIMCYWLKASIMKDRIAVPGGLDFSPTDRIMGARFYPLAVAPPPPPPPPPGAGYRIVITGAGARPTIAVESTA